MHGSRKRLDPHRIPEKQSQPILSSDVDRKPRIGQGRAGVRRKALPFLDSRQGTSTSKPIVISDEIGPKRPKSIVEILRSEILPPCFWYHKLGPLQNPLIIYQRDKM